MFQSTRPRGARRVTVVDEDGDEMFQSTRPRGARPDEDSAQGGSWPVSIHAPAWGATTSGECPRKSSRCFNPRARVGRDVIHCSFLQKECTRFNPRARVGRDPNVADIRTRLAEFQSTRPRGARLAFVVGTPPDEVFQSTRPRGARRLID